MEPYWCVTIHIIVTLFNVTCTYITCTYITVCSNLGDEVRMDYMQFASDEDHYDDNEKYWNRDGITFFTALPFGKPGPAKLDKEYLEKIKKTRTNFERFYELNNRTADFFSEVHNTHHTASHDHIHTDCGLVVDVGNNYWLQQILGEIHGR